MAVGPLGDPAADAVADQAGDRMARLKVGRREAQRAVFPQADRADDPMAVLGMMEVDPPASMARVCAPLGRMPDRIPWTR